MGGGGFTSNEDIFAHFSDIFGDLFSALLPPVAHVVPAPCRAPTCATT